MSSSRIFLVGFSGTGKTAVGRRLASILRWDFVDSDELIVETVGEGIKKIFANKGEKGFREYEKEIINELSKRENVVIATGGGAFIDQQSRENMLYSGLCVCLEAQSETIHSRLSRAIDFSESSNNNDTPEKMQRPLLASEDGAVSLSKIENIKNDRQWAYSKAHWIVSTDYLSTEQVAQEIIRFTHRLSEKIHPVVNNYLAATVMTSAGSYPILVGWGILEKELGPQLTSSGFNGRAFILCDQSVLHPYGRSAQQSLHKSGIKAHLFVFPSGEKSKNLDTVRKVFDWMAELKVERRDVIVSVGGGVAGDLAGFVAATYLRGIALVHIPTTLTAMVDSSIGGKAAVDLPHAKNLVGAFYPPKFVLSDVSALSTLPRRELGQGWAEALKHGFALDKGLVELYETHVKELLNLSPEITTKIISLNVALKASLVSEDEREMSGLRTLLNYGHTVGHAIETAAGYGMYLHGEAVAIGMVAAANLGMVVGKTDPAILERQNSLLAEFNLPLAFNNVSVDQILEAIKLDKKSEAGEISWVILDGVGSSSLYRGIDQSLVREILVKMSK